jgi:hypothetical protein
MLSSPASFAHLVREVREGDPGSETELDLTAWVPFPSHR